MPWGAEDATRHTKKAKSAKKKRQWSHVANSALERGHDEGSAVRQANAVVGGTARRRGKGKKKGGKMMKAAARIMERRKAKKRAQH